MHNACCPIFIRLGSRCRDHAPSAGSLRNVSISHVVALNASWTSSITGIPGYYPEGITLSDVRLVYSSGGPVGTKPGEPVPEQEKEYPTANMFGTLPAYGLYCRHVKDLVLSNVQLRCAERFVRVAPSKLRRNGHPYWQTPDGDPDAALLGDPGTALVADDLIGLDIDALHTHASTKGEPVLQFINVRDAFLRSSRAPVNSAVYLDIQGSRTLDIELRGNQTQNAKTAVRRAAEVPRKAVRSSPH
jgi:hypothetical protein